MSDHASGQHRITTPAEYFIALMVLMGLFGLTLFVYYKQLGTVAAIAVAMAIAVTKATIVVLYFMQVRYASKLAWIWCGLGFIWLFFMGLILLDYQTRSMHMPAVRTLDVTKSAVPVHE